jgi:excinuclease ABC subunit C
MLDAAAGERFEEAAQLRDAMRTVQTLRDRQQKVATAQLGDRDVFGLKVGPSGGAIQVFAMRGGRVVERVELATDPGASPAATPTSCRPPAAVLRARVRRRRSTCRRRSRMRGDGGVAVERGRRRVKISCRSAATSARCRPGDAQRGAVLSHAFNEITAAHFDALETLRSVLGCRRCRAASNASTSPRSRAARPWRRWSCAKTAG